MVPWPNFNATRRHPQRSLSVRTHEQQQLLVRTTMDTLLRAILNDDRARAKELLKADRSLATCRIDQARLYESQIFHWMYIGDTALHLAAAGYRVEIARLLLAAGADPNSATNHRQSGPLHYAADG